MCADKKEQSWDDSLSRLQKHGCTGGAAVIGLDDGTIKAQTVNYVLWGIRED